VESIYNFASSRIWEVLFFCIDDVCVECFRALFLSSLASLKDKEWENIRGRGREGRREIKMG